MATSIVMPQMGYDMQEGTVVRWVKREGEEVARGEVLAEIETDKATVEYEAFVGGVLRKIVAEEGVAIPVGDLIAVITASDEPLPDDLGISPPAEAPAVAQPAVVPSTLDPAPVAPASGEVRASPIARRIAREQGIDLATLNGSGPGGRIVEADVLAAAEAKAREAMVAAAPGGVLASPIARRLARERGIDLTTLTGSGPGGRIVEADVLAAAEAAAVAEPVPAQAEAPAAEESVDRLDLSRMRQTIARVTGDSKREAPHFYVSSDVDMSKAMALRADVNQVVPSESRVSVNDLIVKACAMALQRYPKFNAFFRGDHLQMNANVNIGIAIALESGLIVPGINGCENKTLAEIATASRDLISRAHTGTLRNEEYSGTTFSISNLGMFDVDSFTAIIYPPHAAILAVGRVKEQPVVRDGQVVVCQMMNATLSVDHRVADGAEAAQMLMEVKRLLENPVTLLI